MVFDFQGKCSNISGKSRFMKYDEIHAAEHVVYICLAPGPQVPLYTFIYNLHLFGRQALVMSSNLFPT